MMNWKKGKLPNIIKKEHTYQIIVGNRDQLKPASHKISKGHGHWI